MTFLQCQKKVNFFPWDLTNILYSSRKSMDLKLLDSFTQSERDFRNFLSYFTKELVRLKMLIEIKPKEVAEILNEKNDYKYKIIDYQRGEEAGLKNLTMIISGFKSYGYLKNESGIHRLVRISPFDSNKRRHTSFSSVWVYPEIDKDIEIEINNKDLRIDTFRASGAGGQHINTTDSAVRITHLKYNIVVQSQSERSQHRNRDTAMKMLKSRLYEIELDKKNEEKKKEESNKKQIGWGNQIRSYVLHPYKMVKDLRTNYQTSNAENVLDGEISEFLESTLIDV